MATKKLQILNSLIKEAQNADTLDGKHADEFALASDIPSVDSNLSLTSKNPVENQVITNWLAENVKQYSLSFNSSNGEMTLSDSGVQEIAALPEDGNTTTYYDITAIAGHELSPSWNRIRDIPNATNMNEGVVRLSESSSSDSSLTAATPHHVNVVISNHNTSDIAHDDIREQINNKLDTSSLNSAINLALTQAKESGEFDGADGVSATHSWSGTTLTITSANGTSSADLKGADGDDYILTEADKIEIAEKIEKEISVQSPIFVDSIDEMTDTMRIYVLKSTGTIYTFIGGKTEETSETIDAGCLDNSRMGSDGSIATDVAYAGFVATSNYIDLKAYPLPFTLHLEGADFLPSSVVSYTRLTTYDSNKTKITSGAIVANSVDNYMNVTDNNVVVDNNGDAHITFTQEVKTNNGADMQYIRMSGQGTDASSVKVYVTYETETGSKWVDTEISYTPTLTATDKSEIAAQIDGATIVQAPKYVNSVEEMTDTNRPYVLISTGHIWANAEVTVEKEVTKNIPLEGITDSSRLGSDGSVTTNASYSAYCVTPFIDLLAYPVPFTLHLDGGVFFPSTGTNNIRIASYKEDQTKITVLQSIVNCTDSVLNITDSDVVIDSNGNASITFNQTPKTNNNNNDGVLKYVRFSGEGSSETVRVYVTYKETQTTTGVQWFDTGTTYASTLSAEEKQAMVDEVASMVDTHLLSMIGTGEVTV